MKNKLTDLVTKWEAILSEGNKIKRTKVQKSTALMLENQNSYLEEAVATQGSLRGSGYSDSGYFQQLAIPMVRRTFPELIAHDVVGVQPLTGPVGLAFALRYKASGAYDSVTNAELGYNHIDTSYSGSNSEGMVT